MMISIPLSLIMHGLTTVSPPHASQKMEMMIEMEKRIRVKLHTRSMARKAQLFPAKSPAVRQLVGGSCPKPAGKRGAVGRRQRGSCFPPPHHPVDAPRAQCVCSRKGCDN